MIAHLDTGDPLHAAATAALNRYADDDLRLPASAYAECLVDPARKDMLPAARDHIAALRAGRRTLRLPDALVMATADALEAETVLTGDRRWRRLPRVRVLR